MDRSGPIIALIVMIIVFIAWVIALLVVLDREVGPGCPADPQWLGFCDEIDRQ